MYGLIGGVLIGLASLLASAATGKTPGISGVFARIFKAVPGDTFWRVIFFAGLILGAAVIFAFDAHAATFRPVRSLGLLAAAGVLVGLGTRLGGGCTSGHGICGLGLGSKDSLVATVVFMAMGMLTVLVLKQVAGGVLP